MSSGQAKSARRRASSAITGVTCAAKYHSCQRYWSLIFSIGAAVGSAHLQAVAERRGDPPGPLLGEKLQLFRVGPAKQVVDEVPVGRIAELAAGPQLGRGEAGVVRVAGELDRARLRGEGLDHHLARRVARGRTGRPPGRAAGRCARSPENRGCACDRSASIRPTSVTFGKIQALADHLGADEDVDLAPAELPQDLAEAVLPGHRVGCPSAPGGRAAAPGGPPPPPAGCPCPASGCRGRRISGTGRGPAAPRRRGGSAGVSSVRW